MKNILVTGGAGFIGSNFIHFLLKNQGSITIINYDALTYAGNLENLQTIKNDPRYKFIQGNICDRQKVTNVISENHIDTIVHFAAESHVDRSIEGPLLFVETNVLGTVSLLDAARSFWYDSKSNNKKTFRFHHVSTDEVFGSLGNDDPPFKETTPYSPNSPYAASKAASDHLLRAYHHTYGLPITISNCSNNYGPYQFPEKLIPLIILNALSGKELPVYGDGKQVRDWLFVEDHCEAIHRIICDGNSGETYNIGGNNQPTNLEIIKMICSILDKKKPRDDKQPYSNQIKFITDRPGHDRRYAMDITKIQNSLGWEPMTGLESGLEKTVTWYLDNTHWAKNIQDRKEFRNWVSTHYIHRK